MSFLEKVKDKLKVKYEQAKQERAQTSAANLDIRKQSKVAYLQQKKEEEIKFARGRAKHEVQVRHDRLYKRPSGGSMGFGGTINALGDAIRGPKPASQQVRMRVKGKKGKYHTVTRTVASKPYNPLGALSGQMGVGGNSRQGKNPRDPLRGMI